MVVGPSMAPKIGVRSGGDSVYLRVHTGFDALMMRPTNLLRWTVLWAGLLLMGGSVGAQRVFGPPALQRMQEGHAACGKGLVGVPVDAFSQEKINITINELKEERDAVKDLLPK